MDGSQKVLYYVIHQAEQGIQDRRPRQYIEISPIAVSQGYSPDNTMGDIGEVISNYNIADLFSLVKHVDDKITFATDMAQKYITKITQPQGKGDFYL